MPRNIRNYENRIPKSNAGITKTDFLLAQQRNYENRIPDKPWDICHKPYAQDLTFVVLGYRQLLGATSVTWLFWVVLTGSSE